MATTKTVQLSPYPDIGTENCRSVFILTSPKGLFLIQNQNILFMYICTFSTGLLHSLRLYWVHTSFIHFLGCKVSEKEIILIYAAHQALWMLQTLDKYTATSIHSDNPNRRTKMETLLLTSNWERVEQSTEFLTLYPMYLQAYFGRKLLLFRCTLLALSGFKWIQNEWKISHTEKVCGTVLRCQILRAMLSTELDINLKVSCLRDSMIFPQGKN